MLSTIILSVLFAAPTSDWVDEKSCTVAIFPAGPAVEVVEVNGKAVAHLHMYEDAQWVYFDSEGFSVSVTPHDYDSANRLLYDTLRQLGYGYVLLEPARHICLFD